MTITAIITLALLSALAIAFVLILVRLLKTSDRKPAAKEKKEDAVDESVRRIEEAAASETASDDSQKKVVINKINVINVTMSSAAAPAEDEDDVDSAIFTTCPPDDNAPTRSDMLKLIGLETEPDMAKRRQVVDYLVKKGLIDEEVAEDIINTFENAPRDSSAPAEDEPAVPESQPEDDREPSPEVPEDAFIPDDAINLDDVSIAGDDEGEPVDYIVGGRMDVAMDDFE